MFSSEVFTSWICTKEVSAQRDEQMRCVRCIYCQNSKVPDYTAVSKLGSAFCSVYFKGEPPNQWNIRRSLCILLVVAGFGDFEAFTSWI